MRVILEEKGWTNWRNADKKEFTEQYKEFKLNHRPDGVIHDQYDQPIAIETERTLKRRERYRAIMRNHILAKKHKLWAFVIYAVPTNKLKIALNAIFDDIEYVLLNGVRHEIKEQHRKMFKFYTYDELENLNLERKE